ncbi:hypothetical protein K458DRAFT_408153 [Lentithecium fluviatile CBS 122367]|uniref:DUF7907 domain-containing protein n=1 Tax=Lentithecium fluviatile CBS 122367 TaxID=1168545 RepID=A0A6G1IM44_9PLEO|nr:hypothetical protein K458DRAFT_408153 [Lentithecium fluviatile CBS 122367]
MHLLHPLTIIIALAAAIPSPSPPSISKSPAFRINANPPPSHPLSTIQNWNFSSYHISACSSRAVFSPNSTGRTFYANGTDAEFSSRTATLNTDGGTPPWPWGVSVAGPDEVDEEGRRSVSIACGRGTEGVQVAEWPGTVYYETGSWYVCNATLVYGPAMALFWRTKVERTPEGCVNVELQAWCVDGGGGVEHAFGRESTCYRAAL